MRLCLRAVVVAACVGCGLLLQYVVVCCRRCLWSFVVIVDVRCRCCCFLSVLIVFACVVLVVVAVVSVVVGCG